MSVEPDGGTDRFVRAMLVIAVGIDCLTQAVATGQKPNGDSARAFVKTNYRWSETVARE